MIGLFLFLVFKTVGGDSLCIRTLASTVPGLRICKLAQPGPQPQQWDTGTLKEGDGLDIFAQKSRILTIPT